MTTKTLPEHGTLSRRKHHGCSCPICLAGESDYMRTRTRLMAYGQWQPYVDAEPVRQHVRMLMTYGIGWQRTARLSGVSNGGLSRILYGDYSKGRPPCKRVRALTAEKIFKVKPAFDAVAPSARVDSTGTRRRLQALVAVGWPQIRLAKLLGSDRALVWQQIRGMDSVEASTARAVKDLYDEVWNVDPTTRGATIRWVASSRRLAAANGWPPPAAWDDDCIDSPSAVPDIGEHTPRYVSLAENCSELERQGYSREQIADRLGVTRDGLQRALSIYRQKTADTAAAA